MNRYSIYFNTLNSPIPITYADIRLALQIYSNGGVFLVQLLLVKSRKNRDVSYIDDAKAWSGSFGSEKIK
ncbi:hypothetical protein RIR_jg29334.t1 [Rhizophagus irregularis DAOM 181602=DAOM 197198]|nr:hypothetical protein RIR_jg29334.t1 [Rhizophagus irregularis DAOM 181602=DAOM 197198]